MAPHAARPPLSLAAEGPRRRGRRPGPPPGVTPAAGGDAKRLSHSGAPLPPEAKKSVEAAQSRRRSSRAPEAEGRERLAEKPAESAPKKPAADPPKESRSATAVAPLRLEDVLLRGSPLREPTHRPGPTSLTHFGHDLFDPSAARRRSSRTCPVSPGYVVGPGDEIVVRMWGRVEGTQRVTVDRDGKIFFPKFGSLYVAGKTFEELEAFLKAKISTIAEVSSDVAMGQMKGIRVSVMGEVRFPGGTTSAPCTRRSRRCPPPAG